MFYIKVKLVQRCHRCEMQYSRQLTQCPHCSGLTDEELVWFKQRRDQELQEIAGLGRVFVVLAIIVLIITVFAAAS